MNSNERSKVGSPEPADTRVSRHFLPGQTGHSGTPEVLGSIEPRLWTPPLRPLTPETSYGYAVIEFAEEIGKPLDEWQAWLVIHAGELLEDGRPRFRQILVLVARQNGKTYLLSVLALFWLFVEHRQMVLGLSTNLAYAKEAWWQAVQWAEVELADGVAGVRLAAGEEALSTGDGCRYRIAASNRRGGRSLTVHRLIIDELREHADWSAMNAAVPTMRAVPDAQAFMISNQGDDQSVVLDSMRKAALTFLETGDGDERFGLFEYSAPDGSDPEDPAALAAANPNLGRRVELDSLVADARRAKAAGGEELAGFRTEAMCMRVHQMNPGIDPDRWAAGADPQPMDDLRDRVVLCLDVSLNATHATLIAAATESGGTVRAEVVARWQGQGCTAALRRELPALVAKVNPRALGWFPTGPAAVVAADLAERPSADWPPRGVKLEEIRADVASVCMGAADLVAGGSLRHPDDPMLNEHVAAATKAWRGDAWVFARRGSGPIDGAYALAGAVHLARMLPPPRSPVVVL